MRTPLALKSRDWIASALPGQTQLALGHPGQLQKLRRRFSAPAPTIWITEAQRDSIFEAEVAGVGEQWEKSVREIAKPSQLPTTWPKWSGIAVDRASRIRIARPAAKGAASVLDVFPTDGILLGSVPAPDPKILEGFWTSSRVYLKDENAEGLPRIRVFRIDTMGTAGR